MINFIQLQGTEKRLYQLVGPLVMDPEILRKNNNYPFKTSKDYTWFIAQRGQKVIGFVPVEIRGHSAIINNYYIEDGEEDQLKQLVEQAVAEFFGKKKLSSVVLVEHQAIFAECGFTPEKMWKLYIKMKKE